MLNISFVGDVCFNGEFANKIEKGEEVFDIGVSQIIDSTDNLCCNFEAPETGASFSNKGGTLLRNAKGSLSYISSKGFNLINIANNHICDCGKEGLIDTINSIRSQNLQFTGAGLNIEEAFSPIVIEDKEQKVALIAFADKIPPIATESSFGMAVIPRLYKMKKMISQLKDSFDYVVLMYHGGEEFSAYPSPSKRKLLKRIAIQTNVDAIISHHSHTFQGIERVKGKPVFYSLGNFLFDLEDHSMFKYTGESAIVTLSFGNSKIDIDYFPTICDSKGGIVKQGNDSFRKEIEARSDFSDYKRKWRSECYRIVFERPAHETLNPEGESLQNKKVYTIFFKKKFYERFFEILGCSQMRSLYLNAILFKLFHKKADS